jgi:hypothetical protein
MRTEEIHEGSQAIVEAVNFLTGDKNSVGTRNSQTLQPTIATQNVSSSFANSLLSLSLLLVETNPLSIFPQPHIHYINACSTFNLYRHGPQTPTHFMN